MRCGPKLDKESAGLLPVARHQLVYKLLNDEMDKGSGGIHVLQVYPAAVFINRICERDVDTGSITT